MMATHGEKGVHGEFSIPRFLPFLLCYILVIFVHVAEPVAAFSCPKTSIGLGISPSHRIRNGKNHTSDGVLLNSASQGIPDGDEDEAQAAEQRPRLFSSSLGEVRSWNEKVRTAYRRRTNADPSFFAKSVTEVLVAAGTQLMAEWNRRGAARMATELDFVVPAVLTAVFGKYYRCVEKERKIANAEKSRILCILYCILLYATTRSMSNY